MNVSAAAIVLGVLSFAGVYREVDGGSASSQDPKIVVDIRCPSARSYSGDRGQGICEYAKPTVTLYRIDPKGAKVKVLTLTGDSGGSVSSAGAGIGRLTLKGNVRGESSDGGIVRADTAEIDLATGSFTYRGRLASGTPDK